MGKEVDRFCEFIESDPRGSGLISHCCLLLGEHPKRNDEPWSDDRPMAELYRKQTLSDLRSRMNHLIDDEELFPGFVIPGLFVNLVSFFAHISRPDAPSDAIDAQLDFIGFLERQSAMPVSKRHQQLTDEQLQQIIEKTKQNMTGGSERRERAAETLLWIQEQWEQRFPWSYWTSNP